MRRAWIWFLSSAVSSTVDPSHTSLYVSMSMIMPDPSSLGFESDVSMPVMPVIFCSTVPSDSYVK